MRLVVFILLLCFSCSVEEETVYRINTSRFNSLSQIAIDSTQIFRNNRNNTLNVEVRYQAKTYNAAYDSVKWELPGGTPSNVSDVKYVTNTNTNKQYKWFNESWISSHEGVYNSGFWRLIL